MKPQSFEEYQAEKRAREQAAPLHTTRADEGRKNEIKERGLEALRFIYSNQAWERWIDVGEAMLVITEEACAAVGAERWSKDNKPLVKLFNRKWDEYERRAHNDPTHKPLSKQERAMLRFVMEHPEVGAWRATLPGPNKRRLNHPNAVVNAWKRTQPKPKPQPHGPQPHGPQPHEPWQMRQGSAEATTIAALRKELTAAKVRIEELEKADAGENARLQARICELEDKLALAEIASGRVPKTVEELVARRRVAEEIRKAERAAAKAARQAQAPAPEPEETIASLSEKLKQAQQQLKGYQTRVRNLNAHIRAVASGKGVRMSKSLFRHIQKHLHPDKAMSDPKEFKRLNELSQEFNSFKILSPDD